MDGFLQILRANGKCISVCLIIPDPGCPIRQGQFGIPCVCIYIHIYIRRPRPTQGGARQGREVFEEQQQQQQQQQEEEEEEEQQQQQQQQQ